MTQARSRCRGRSVQVGRRLADCPGEQRGWHFSESSSSRGSLGNGREPTRGSGELVSTPRLLARAQGYVPFYSSAPVTSV